MKLDELKISKDEINYELQNGARFVIFPYAISIIIMTFTRSSSVRFIRKTDSALKESCPYLLISLIFGWWGIPHGPMKRCQLSTVSVVRM